MHFKYPGFQLAVAVAMGAIAPTGEMLLHTLDSRVVAAAQATLIALAEVLLAPLRAWLFLSQSLTTGTLTGGTILLAAVILNAAGRAGTT